MHEAAHARAPGAVEHELRAAHVHVEQLTNLTRGMDHRGRVHDGGAGDAVEELIDHRGIAYVAGDHFDPRVDHLEERRVGALTHQAADALPVRL